MNVKSESEVAQSYLTLSDPMTAAYQAPPSMGFSRREYWSGVPLPSPRSSTMSVLFRIKYGDAVIRVGNHSQWGKKKRRYGNCSFL